MYRARPLESTQAMIATGDPDAFRGERLTLWDGTQLARDGGPAPWRDRQKGRDVRFDCFMFFNELELLEVRLAELSPVIDVFVIVEAPWTFQGEPKPLLFDENRARFRPYLSRIRHLVADLPPAIVNQWSREFHQRNCLKRGLSDAAADDFAMISDVDEIVRAEAVVEADRQGVFTLFRMELYRYYMDWREGPWLKVFGGPAGYIREMQDLSEPRLTETDYLHRFVETGESQVIPNAGWHFSWLGGLGKQREKVGVTCHWELAPEEFEVLTSGSGYRNGWHVGVQMEAVDVDDTWPAYITERRCPPSWFRPREDGYVAAR